MGTSVFLQYVQAVAVQHTQRDLLLLCVHDSVVAAAVPARLLLTRRAWLLLPTWLREQAAAVQASTAEVSVSRNPRCLQQMQGAGADVCHTHRHGLHQRAAAACCCAAALLLDQQCCL